MDWYYAVGADRKGPINEQEFQRLVQQGVITSQTLVWREGMANWQPHGGGAPPPMPGNVLVGETVCAGCGRTFASSDVVSLAGGLYCAACKPLALQRLREGGAATTAIEEMRKEHLKHEASVQSIGVLYYLGGIGLLLVGIFTGMMFTVVSGNTGRGPDLFASIVIAALFVLLGIGQLWTGFGLRRLKKWARIPTGILSGLGLLGFPLGTIINAYILWLVFSQKGTVVFSDEYRAVIEQTPHIKYRTSIVVWILLGLVLLLIAIGIIATIVGARR